MKLSASVHQLVLSSLFSFVGVASGMVQSNNDGEIIVCPCSANNDPDTVGTCFDDDHMIEPGAFLTLCLFTPVYSTATLQAVDRVYLTDSLGKIQARQTVLEQSIPCINSCVIETPIWLDFFGVLDSTTSSSEPGMEYGLLTVDIMATVTDESPAGSLDHYDVARVVSAETTIVLNTRINEEPSHRPHKIRVSVYGAVFGMAVLLQTTYFLIRHNLLSWRHRNFVEDARTAEDLEGFDLTPEQMMELNSRSLKHHNDIQGIFRSQATLPEAPPFNNSSRSFAATNSVDSTPRISNKNRKTRRVTYFEDDAPIEEECKEEIRNEWDEVTF